MIQLLKFGAVLIILIICDYEWLFDGSFLVEAETAVYCYRAVFSELVAGIKLAVGKLDLSRGVLLGVLDHGSVAALGGGQQGPVPP